jgi:hypothetical protein
MPDIVLATFTARFHHCAMGLRYLQANLGELEARSALLEFDLEKSPLDAAEVILAHHPRVVGLSVHVWNARLTQQLAGTLKSLRPDLVVILGGPEVSFAREASPAAAAADCVIAGEGDLAFAQVCRQVLSGEKPPRWVEAGAPDLTDVAMPYRLYSAADLAHRTVYVESSRGCPFGCEFCLSSLDVPVRRFPLERFLAEMQTLLDRGLLGFKFVDRTFNVDRAAACSILDFFLERLRPGLFLHFEVIPDRLQPEIVERLARFPAGTVQLELGVQTLNEAVATRIGRRQDNAAVERNLRMLREQTQVHLHADLVAGLPGESLESFAEGFNRLWAMRPHEIQLGILKRLRGAPIARHTQEWRMVYSEEPPYEVLQTGAIYFTDMQRLRRMARYWDMIANSGHFQAALPLVLGQQPFENMLALSDRLCARLGRTHAIPLPRLFEVLLETAREEVDRAQLGEALAADYLRGGRRDLPDSLAPLAPARPPPSARPPGGTRRQDRHPA